MLENNARYITRSPPPPIPSPESIAIIKEINNEITSISISYFTTSSIPDMVISKANIFFNRDVLILSSRNPPTNPPATAGTINGINPLKSKLLFSRYTMHETIDIGSVTHRVFAKISRTSDFSLIARENKKTIIIPPPEPSNPLINPAISPPKTIRGNLLLKKFIFSPINLKNSLKNIM